MQVVRLPKRACASLFAFWLLLGGGPAFAGEWLAGDAVLELRPNHRLLAERGLGLRLADGHALDVLSLELSGTLAYERSGGKLGALVASRWQAARSLAFTHGGRTRVLRGWRAIPVANATALDIVDASGAVWLHLDHAHFDIDNGTWRFALEDMDFRIGPALAAWTGGKVEPGLAIGAARLEAPVRLQGAGGDIAKSCQSLHWPGETGYVGDVELTDIDTLQAECNGPCDGLGSNAQALVKLTPSVDLKNFGTADMPWIRKFIISPYSYPYPGNDQHPFLIWNVYREDADGALTQIARSGAKHAFSTQNTGSGCNCPVHNVLAPLCEDNYGVFTNDNVLHLGPRAEVLARTGQWGRCGSIFDPDCDGVENPTATGPFGLRAAVPEAALAPTLHPGASYFLEAWYVVRDDADIYNSMGYGRFNPQWSGTAWQISLSAAHAAGPLIDRWVDPVLPGPGRANVERVTSEGRFKLAVRTQDLGNGRTRYDYALMNFELSRPATKGQEPNLRVVSNRGIAAFVVPLRAGVTVEGLAFADGDEAAGDWTAVVSPGVEVRWTAPGGNTLDWGSMYRFSLIADAAPQTSRAETVMAEAGTPMHYVVDTLAPGPANRLFADGME